MEPQENSTPSRWSGLQVRIASAVIFALLVGAVLWFGGWLFTLFVLLAALIMMREFAGLVLDNNALERTLGMFYVCIPCASLLWLRNIDIPTHANAGFFLTLYVIAVVSATDIGAYFAGRQIGGAKLAPSISPNKTWAGLGGGMLAAAIVGGFVSSFTPFPITFFGGVGLGALLAVIAQVGDLIESWLKRRAGVKDSGTLLPGHGGLLDRIDGYILVLPLFALLFALSGLV